jgi:hypothetical protein
MSASPAPFEAFSADGHNVRWSTWDDGHVEAMALAWDNEAWTATGHVGRENVQYVLRVSPTWRVRQFLLFRDLDEPDLWLAIDAHHRWGEVNGSIRPELGTSADIELNCTPFTATIPIRRLGLAVGEAAEIDVISVDVDTLAAVSVPTRYERVGQAAWRATTLPNGAVREFEVDQFGLVVDEPGRFKRQPSDNV